MIYYEVYQNLFFNNLKSTSEFKLKLIELLVLVVDEKHFFSKYLNELDYKNTLFSC